MPKPNKRWCVYSPDIELYPMSYDPPEPAAYGACAVELEAPTRREAIRLSIHLPEMQRWVEDQRSDHCCPFTGLKAELLEDKEVEDA